MAKPQDDIPTAVIQETANNLEKVLNAPEGQAFDFLCRAAAAFLKLICDHEIKDRAKNG